MKNTIRCFVLILSGIVVFLAMRKYAYSNVDDSVEIGRAVRIHPDYADIVIPPNIAPLNFMVDEPGQEYRVEIGVAGTPDPAIRIRSRTNRVIMPANQWRRLLSAGRGKNLVIDFLVKDPKNRWTRFRPVHIRVAGETIDSHVVYRLINPAYTLWWNMGIYQRNLADFHEDAVFTNRMTRKNCMNCHSFCANRPEMMMFHMRAEYGGTMLVMNGKATKIDTRTDHTLSPGVYPAWHPGGRRIAFSVNKIFQSFHAQKDHTINVYDKDSDLIIYDIPTNTVTTSPKISTGRLENLPAWSPDGRYLYFCSGPERAEKKDYKEIKYDLMRIAYNEETNRWGEVETVLSSAKTGKSITFPRVSPDGRYLLFCMCDYGYFAIHYPSSDLYLLDLKTRNYKKLDVNSESSESYHSWSSNGRWFVFASKRDDGLCSRLYLSYLDSSGIAHKPFLMPQRDPAFYDTFIMNYNAPELIEGPVKTSHWTLMKAATRPPVKADFDSTVCTDSLSWKANADKP
jgi:hypothetical protein